ncbi:4a-hydroxytetrahydrobiopterin dehydratase [Candidatus Jorgensenbacteria bacterium]|nr:4a-hydroxytetrahydrobiopterin dehydratase [Candidatus Jorgensenbacteria bacterium]
MNLKDKKCIPCEGGTPSLTSEETKTLLKKVSEWQLDSAVKKIWRAFSFKNFVEAMKFVNRVADIAETEGHHPDIHIFYNRVHIELWTHAVNGLSENDFIVAAKIDALM